ncbi:hypothetical protein PSPO01_14613 [Paraphaeosphaeria sporulosa]
MASGSIDELNASPKPGPNAENKAPGRKTKAHRGPERSYQANLREDPESYCQREPAFHRPPSATPAKPSLAGGSAICHVSTATEGHFGIEAEKTRIGLVRESYNTTKASVTRLSPTTIAFDNNKPKKASHGSSIVSSDQTFRTGVLNGGACRMRNGMLARFHLVEKASILPSFPHCHALLLLPLFNSFGLAHIIPKLTPALVLKDGVLSAIRRSVAPASERTKGEPPSPSSFPRAPNFPGLYQVKVVSRQVEKGMPGQNISKAQWRVHMEEHRPSAKRTKRSDISLGDTRRLAQSCAVEVWVLDHPDPNTEHKAKGKLRGKATPMAKSPVTTEAAASISQSSEVTDFSRSACVEPPSWRVGPTRTPAVKIQPHRRVPNPWDTARIVKMPNPSTGVHHRSQVTVPG